MTAIKQIIKPVASISVGSVTLATDPITYTQTTPATDTWYDIKTLSFTVEEIRNKSLQALDFTVSGTLSVNGATGSFIRCTLNGVPISPLSANADGRVGVDTSARGYSFTGRINDYSQKQTIKFQCLNTAGNQTYTLISMQVDSRVITYV